MSWMEARPSPGFVNFNKSIISCGINRPRIIVKANLQLLKQIKAYSPYNITSKITIMIKIKMFKSASLHVDHSIKAEPCLGWE